MVSRRKTMGLAIGSVGAIGSVAAVGSLDFGSEHVSCRLEVVRGPKTDAARVNERIDTGRNTMEFIWKVFEHQKISAIELQAGDQQEKQQVDSNGTYSFTFDRTEVFQFEFHGPDGKQFTWAKYATACTEGKQAPNIDTSKYEE